MPPGPPLPESQGAERRPTVFAPTGRSQYLPSRRFHSCMNYTDLNEVLSSACRPPRNVRYSSPQSDSNRSEDSNLRIAVKYGLVITVCFISWVVIAHRLVPDPQSLIHSAGAGTFVNLVQILAIVFAIKSRREESGGALNFKD